MSLDIRPLPPLPPERKENGRVDNQAHVVPFPPNDRVVRAVTATSEAKSSQANQQPPPFESHFANRRQSSRRFSKPVKRPSPNAATTYLATHGEYSSGSLYSRPPPPGVRLVIFPPIGACGLSSAGPVSAGPPHSSYQKQDQHQTGHQNRAPRSGGGRQSNASRQINRQGQSRRWPSNHGGHRRQQSSSAKSRGRTFHKRHDEFSEVYGRPKRRPAPVRSRKRKGDFYRPPPVSVRVLPQDGVKITDSNNSSLPPDQQKPSSTPCTLTDVEIDNLLDDAFADLGLEIEGCATTDETDVEGCEREADDEDEEDGFCTPPFAEWEYPDEIYVADREKFRKMGGTCLDRTFIGIPPPPDVLDGLDDLP